MAYFEQKLMSAQPGATTASGSLNPQIVITNGAIADDLIDRAVTYDGAVTDPSSPPVKLAGDGEVVIGSLVGVSYGKLQIAVEGWDVRFKVGDAAVTQHSKIVGGIRNDGTNNVPGYIKSYVLDPTTAGSPTDAELATIDNGRGSVMVAAAAMGTARVSMKLGG